MTSPSASRTPTTICAAVRAELHGVVQQVDENLAEPVLVAADRRDALRQIQRRSAGPGVRRRAAAARRWPGPRGRGRRRRAAAAPSRSRSATRSSSSLTIWVRWPVSTSILEMRSRRRGEAVSASRAAVSASRLIVVSGVRSSCERLSMNSARIRCRRRNSETSSRTSQTPDDRGTAGPDRHRRRRRWIGRSTRRWPSRAPWPSGRCPRCGRRRRPPAPNGRPSLPALRSSIDVGGAVRELDRQVVAKTHHAGRQQLGQIAGVVERLLRVPAGVFGLLERVANSPLDIVRVGRPGRLPEALDGPAARNRHRESPAEQQARSDDENDCDRIHASSMAQPVDFGWTCRHNSRAGMRRTLP